MRGAIHRVGSTVAAAALAAAVHLLPATVLAQGCAMCATAVDGADDPLAHGLNVSIIFLLSMPFVLVGTVGAWFSYAYWRNRARRPALRVLSQEGEGIL